MIKREKTVPFHELAHVCCSSGGCLSIPCWPMQYAQDGLLRLEGEENAEVPVDLIGFSTRGVSVVMGSARVIEQGEQALLITQAHGAGCHYQRVACCWHRPHPHDPQLQCVGLRFEPTTP